MMDFNDYSGKRLEEERSPVSLCSFACMTLSKGFCLNVKDVMRPKMYHPPEGASPWAPALQGDLPGVKSGNVTPVTGKGKGKARADDAEEEQGANGPVQDRGDPFIAVRSIETGIIDVSDCNLDAFGRATDSRSTAIPGESDGARMCSQAAYDTGSRLIIMTAFSPDHPVDDYFTNHDTKLTKAA
jgi:hypothetical protein